MSSGTNGRAGPLREVPKSLAGDRGVGGIEARSVVGYFEFSEFAHALQGHFDVVWESLTPKEQAHLVGMLVSNVDYDGTAGSVTIAFHPAGIHALAGQFSQGNAA